MESKLLQMARNNMSTKSTSDKHKRILKHFKSFQNNGNQNQQNQENNNNDSISKVIFQKQKFKDLTNISMKVQQQFNLRSSQQTEDKLIDSNQQFQPQQQQQENESKWKRFIKKHPNFMKDKISNPVSSVQKEFSQERKQITEDKLNYFQNIQKSENKNQQLSDYEKFIQKQNFKEFQKEIEQVFPLQKSQIKDEKLEEPNQQFQTQQQVEENDSKWVRFSTDPNYMYQEASIPNETNNLSQVLKDDNQIKNNEQNLDNSHHQNNFLVYSNNKSKINNNPINNLQEVQKEEKQIKGNELNLNNFMKNQQLLRQKPQNSPNTLELSEEENEIKDNDLNLNNIIQSSQLLQPNNQKVEINKFKEQIRVQKVELEIKDQQIKLLEEDNKNLREELLMLKKNHFKQYQDLQNHNNELLKSYETRVTKLNTIIKYFSIQFKQKQWKLNINKKLNIINKNYRKVNKNKNNLSNLKNWMDYKKNNCKVSHFLLNISRKKKYGNNIIDTLLEEKFAITKKYNELLIDMENMQKKNKDLEQKYETSNSLYQSFVKNTEKSNVQTLPSQFSQQMTSELKTENPFGNSFLQDSTIEENKDLFLDDLTYSQSQKNLRNLKGDSKAYEKKIKEIAKRHEKMKRNKKKKKKKKKKKGQNESFSDSTKKRRADSMRASSKLNTSIRTIRTSQNFRKSRKSTSYVPSSVQKSRNQRKFYSNKKLKRNLSFRQERKSHVINRFSQRKVIKRENNKSIKNERIIIASSTSKQLKNQNEKKNSHFLRRNSTKQKKSHANKSKSPNHSKKIKNNKNSKNRYKSRQKDTKKNVQKKKYTKSQKSSRLKCFQPYF